MHGDGSDLSVCLSFSTYSSDKFSEAAAKISHECSAAQLPEPDFFSNDDVFEFGSAAVGEIGPVFPIFNRGLLREEDDQSEPSTSTSSVQISLKELFISEERDAPFSSDDDEVDGVSPGTFCVWTPRSPEPPSPARCKKSKSTGSGSKRWRLRDLLLRRSNSDGKDSFLFLAPPPANSKKVVEEKPEKNKAAGKSNGKGISAGAHEIFYKRNRAVKEGDKRRSYLPYRQDLVGLGFFPPVSTKSYPPF